jgi:hypothetical protein
MATRRSKKGNSPEAAPVAPAEDASTQNPVMQPTEQEQPTSPEVSEALAAPTETSDTLQVTQPQPGDDYSTLPQLGPKAYITGDAKKDDEANLNLHLYSIAKYAKTHTLTLAQKRRLAEALWDKCVGVLNTVDERLRGIPGISDSQRIAYWGEYQRWCRRFVKEVRRTLKSGSFDVLAADQLRDDQVGLWQKTLFIQKLQPSKPGLLSCLARGLKHRDQRPLPPNIARVGKAVNDELERSGAKVCREQLEIGIARVTSSPELQKWIREEYVVEQPKVDAAPDVTDEEKYHCFCGVLAVVRDLYQGDSCLKPFTSDGWASALRIAIRVCQERIPLEQAIMPMWSAVKQQVQEKVRKTETADASTPKAGDGESRPAGSGPRPTGQRDKPPREREGARQKEKSGPAPLGDSHSWCSIGLSKREIGLAVGLADDKKIAQNLNSLCQSLGIVVRPANPKGKHHKTWFVACDTLRGPQLERFRRYMRDLHHYKMPEQPETDFHPD